MWSIIIGLSIAPLLVTQTVMLMIKLLRTRIDRTG
jgi:hypothetical protein